MICMITLMVLLVMMTDWWSLAAATSLCICGCRNCSGDFSATLQGFRLALHNKVTLMHCFCVQRNSGLLETAGLSMISKRHHSAQPLATAKFRSYLLHASVWDRRLRKTRSCTGSFYSMRALS